MPAAENRRDHVGCEEGEPDETREVGTADPLLRGDLSQGQAGVLKQARPYRMGPDEQTYWRAGLWVWGLSVDSLTAPAQNLGMALGE
jgi:hypothetical protein